MNKVLRKVLIGILLTVLSNGILYDPTSAHASSAVTKRMIVSGGSPGGTSNLSANAVAAVAFKYCNIETTVVGNSTFTQVNVLQNNEADVATVVGYQGLDAYKGEWKGRPYPGLRTLYQCNGQKYHFFVLKDSPIRSFEDLKGKRVVVGKRGFFAEDVTKKIHKALGLEYGKYFTPVNIGHSEAVAALVSGNIDAYVIMSKAPQPQGMQLTEGHPCRTIGLTTIEMNKVLAMYPDFLPTTIAANSYKGMDKEIGTVEGWMFFSCDKSIPEDAAYCLTKNFWEHQDFAAIQYAEMKNYRIQDIEKLLAAPYHKGALRYYKERGLKVPDAMIPPETK